MLQIAELDAGYGMTKVLKGISLRVPPQSIVAIIGRNGAGKSTTLKAISGLNRRMRGEIVFDGSRIEALPPQDIVRRGIAHVPEGRRIFPRLTVRENLLIGGYTARRRSVIERRIEAVLDVFPMLREHFKRPGSALSGGQQQMLALARSLISAPRLLLLDEPTMGLAPKIVEQVASYIADLRKDGLTVLLVEQNANVALSISDYAYVLETGQIVLEGRSSDLRADDAIRRTYLGI